MQGLTLDVFLSLAVPLSLYFIISLFGAFTSDILRTLRGKNKKIKVTRIFIGATFSAFLMFGLEKILLSKISINIIVFITFFVGSIGFEVFNKLSSIDNIIRFWNAYQEMKTCKLPTSKEIGIDDEDDDEDDSS